MTYYKDVPVFINETGFFVRSASINSSASVGQASFSSTKASSFASGPQTTVLNLEYLTRLTKDPLLQDIIAFKDHANTGNFNLAPYPFVVKIGSISGTFYLDSVALNLEANSLIGSTVSMRSFVPISGNGATTQFTDSSIAQNDFSHTRTLDFSNEYNQSYDSNIYGFSYSFQQAILPSYILGSRVPNQITRISASETSSVQFDSYKEISPTGKIIDEYMDGYNKVVLSPFLKTGIYESEKITISLANQIVDSINTVVAINQPMKVSIEGNRSF